MNKNVMLVTSFVVLFLCNTITYAARNWPTNRKACYCCAALTNTAASVSCCLLGTLLHVAVPECSGSAADGFFACRGRNDADPVMVFAAPTCCFAGMAAYFFHKAKNS